MGSKLNPMAKPFLIGSECILSVVEGMLEVVTALLFYRSTFYSLAASPRPLYLCTSLVRHSFSAASEPRLDGNDGGSGRPCSMNY